MVQTSWLECILVTILSYSDDVCYQSTDNNCLGTFHCFQTRSRQCFCIAYFAKIELKSDKKYHSNGDKFISNQFAKFGLVLSKNKNRPKIFTELLKTCWFSALPKFFIHLWGTGVLYKWRVSRLLCLVPGILLHLGMGWITLCLLWNLSQSYEEPVFVSHNNWSKLLDLMFSLEWHKNVIM